MPPKIRELVDQLLAVGFLDRGGKGSQRNFRHPSGINITVSGKPGDDAKHYQVRDVQQAIGLVRHDK